ncbi:MAG: hypothetical protein CL505_00300 [Actinobacteria bacterium]|nr:hypothetical protein [Actinomycetota bacterium]|tara:strand:+ start:4114 stop:5409 length:1296 start_codon:yes stop_codon:yes gene_type:complete
MLPAVLAHGVGGRSDLPVPEWQAAWGATVALVLSFAALGLLWHRPRLRDMSVGIPVTPAVAGIVRSIMGVLRAAVLIVFLVVLAAGLVGADDALSNISPVSVYVLFWIGIPVASILLGPVWRAVSPWETLGRLVSRPSDGEAPGWLTSGWAALVPISIFHWLELAYHDGANPRVLGWLGLAYTLGLMAVSRRWGWEEARRAEGFGVLFDAVASLSPFRRDGSGRLFVRPPLVGVAGSSASPVLLAVILAALGGTAFDGFSRTRVWGGLMVGRAGWEATAVSTVGLVWIVALVGLAYHLACRSGGRLTGDPDFAARFGASLVPILVGYDLAHYFSLLLLEGQTFIALASDPLGRGWDLFGTVDNAVNWTLVSTTAVGWVQLGSIVIGHMVAVVVAHDRAVEEWRPTIALRSQYPMLVVMVAYTVLALLLITG